jgi:hypothetical protein
MDSHSRVAPYYTSELEANIENGFASDYNRPKYSKFVSEEDTVPGNMSMACN